MYGAIIGLALSAASTAYGAVANKKNADKEQAALNAEKAANEAYRNRYYYEDPLARAGARRMMQKQLENVQRLNRSAQGTKAVVGGTDEAIASIHQANAGALADTAGQIVASAEARRDKVDDNYMATRRDLSRQQMALDAQRAENVANAVQQAGQAASQFATSMDSVIDDKINGLPRKSGGIRKPDSLTDSPAVKGPTSYPDAGSAKASIVRGNNSKVEMPFAPGSQGVGNKRKNQ